MLHMNTINKLRSISESGNLIITNKKDLIYLLGFKGASGQLIITNSNIYLITNSLEYKSLKSTPSLDKKIELVKFPSSTLNSLFRDIKSFEVDELKVSTYNMLCDRFPDTKFTQSLTIQKFLRKSQSIKSLYEMECIRRATKISELALLKTIPYIVPGTKEIDIAQKLKENITKYRSSVADYDIMVFSGVRTSYPHSETTTNVVQYGDLILIDAAAKEGGYNSDFTRMISIGKPNQEIMDIFNIVCEAEQSIINRIKPGVSAGYVTEEADKILTKYGYIMPGAYGHGVGLRLHEYPTLTPNSNHIIEERMILAVEPAVYIEDKFGIRIEDTVVVGSNSAMKMNELSNEIIII